MLSEPAPAVVHWTVDGQAQQAQWHADNGLKPPKRMVVVDDTLNADAAYRMACEGTGLLWQGDFQNAKQLLQALTAQHFDHYFLCAPDIPWEPDPLRENPSDRDRLFEIYQRELVAFNRPFTILKGDLKTRQELIKVTVYNLLNR
jgi:nicotinamide riboside kinase